MAAAWIHRTVNKTADLPPNLHHSRIEVKTMTNMSELEFIHAYCFYLTYTQNLVAERCIRNKSFIGVGREIGGMDFLPMIRIEGKPDRVIRPDGFTTPAAADGRRLWEPEPAEEGENE